MKILSWNVNGLRKLGPLDVLFERLDADILCFQETRVSGKSDPHLERLAFVKGYHSFFSICKQKRGYSGVATFCKKGSATPVDAGEGLKSSVGGAKVIPNADGVYGACSLEGCPCELGGCSQESMAMILEEGRCVITDHQRFVLINIYAPAVSVEGRGAFKMHFLHALEAKMAALRRSGRHVLVVGDFNICPSVRDVAEPMPPSHLAAWEARPSRRWLMSVLAPSGLNFVDSFRERHPSNTNAYTCWSEATRARENNHGVRIDLIILDRDLFTLSITAAGVHSEIEGSDHCPVSAVLKFSDGALPSPKDAPKFCTMYMPRFAMRQQTLKSMLSSPVTCEATRKPSALSSSERFSKSLKEQFFFGSSKATASSRRPKKTKAQHSQATISSFFSLQTQKASGESFDRKQSPEGHCTADSSNPSLKLTPPIHKPTSMQAESTRKRKATAKAWRRLLSGPPPPPLCKHGKPCVLKTVGKTGENRGRTFFTCPYPAGIGKDADCNFFQWAPFKAGMQLLPH